MMVSLDQLSQENMAKAKEVDDLKQELDKLKY